ncbi:hypothetical protein RhiirA4_395438, partial [Rhizophagus irregularis]
MNIIYICCFLLSLPFINFSSFLWLLIIFILVIFHLLIQLLSFFCSTSASNNTSEDTPLNNILKDIIPEIPSCFEGLEEQWADLNKNGRDFRKEIWKIYRKRIYLERTTKILTTKSSNYVSPIGRGPRRQINLSRKALSRVNNLSKCRKAL